MPEKCLIIGLGQIGMGYDLIVDPAIAIYSHARALSLHPAFELSGAVDASREQCALFQEHYPSSQDFNDLQQALETIDPAVVVIATPTQTHSKIVGKVLKYSCPRAILCEKPLTYDPMEASQMLEACESGGVKIFVNYIRRTDPGVIEIKKRIASCRIEPPIKGNVWYSKGFLNNGSHFFNLLEFWLGKFVRATPLALGHLWEGQDPELDVQVEFEGGKVIFQASWGKAYSHNTLELLSPSGRLRYEEGGKHITWQSIEKHPTLSGYKILAPEPETIPNDMKRYQWNTIDQLANALADKEYTLCTGRQGLRTLEAMHQIIDNRYL